MTLSEFAKTLYPFCGNGNKTSDFVATMIENIMLEGEENPLLKHTDILAKIYNGSRSISQRDASAILGKLDRVKFVGFIADFSDDTLQALCDVFIKKGMTATIHDIADKCSDIMVEIITKLASTSKITPITLMEAAEELVPAPQPFMPSARADANAYLLAETKATCPICNKPLMRSKDGKAVIGYVITPIYPLKPTNEQLKELSGLHISSDTTANENKIAICHSCSADYLSAFSKSSCLKLSEIKYKIAQDFRAAAIIDSVKLEDDIREIVIRIASADKGDLSDSLSYSALLITEKITTDNTPLILKIEWYVSNYYKYIKELFIETEKENKLNFDTIAREVKLCADSLIKSGLSQEQVFTNLVAWIKGKTAVTSIAACEIVIAFFVQNCEVFNAITK